MRKPSFVDKQVWLVVACLIVMLTTSCQEGSNRDIDIDYDKIHSGTEGLVISVVEGAPPSEVLEEQEFQFIAKLENRGAADIKGGILKLILDEDYIEGEGDNTELVFDLGGKTVFNPKGDTQLFSFNLRAKQIKEEMSTLHDSEIILAACYRYHTEVRKDVCIDTDYFNINQGSKEKVCQVTSLNLGSQGAPVEVFMIEPKFTTEHSQVVPQFLIHIRNVGSGQVIKEDSLVDVCGSSELESEAWNTVYVTAKLGNQPMVCEPSEGGRGKLRLKEGEDFIKCRAQTPLTEGTPSYVTVLNINLTYGYTESISKMVRINRI
ncbi:hypothetical protein DRJ48_00670 [Candidatus Woesearchaeota archaeon]|nr:hypothetical protein [Candidatus Woesearchaeota archaeon]RLE43518.1 MAG: hypothetical protein DRJ48_00670 [Candidatus Woesearchaeota archaeon]